MENSLSRRTKYRRRREVDLFMYAPREQAGHACRVHNEPKRVYENNRPIYD